MHCRALHLSAFLLALLPGSKVFAHGVPPDAYAVLSHDAAGPRAVSLSLGVALRRAPQQYQFVCPMAWGDQFAAPVAALADGTIVLGATDGLMLLAEDGTLRPHPDPAAVGRASDVVRSSRGVFALRPTTNGSELLAVDAQTVRVLWKDTKSLYSLAALDDQLVLLRVMGTMLEQVTVSAVDGRELERQMVVLPASADYAYARANAGIAYALLVLPDGTIQLGNLRMNTFTKLAEGQLSIAGPLNVANATLLALDGKLEQLTNGLTAPLVDDHNVVCLGEHDGLTYACVKEGITRVNGQALAEPLFRWSWLTPPDLERVPEGDERFLCNSQWQDLRFDINLLPPDPNAAPPLASMAAGAAGLQPPAATVPMAGVAAPAAAGGPAIAPEQPASQGSTGCATRSSGSAPRGSNAFGLVLVLLVAVVRCRRRRGR